MYELLKTEFEETKQTLRNVEDNIRRITGRDPDQFSVLPGGNAKLRNGPNFLEKRDSFIPKKRPLAFLAKPDNEEFEESPAAEEESADEDGSPVKKPSVASTVVPTHKDVRTRRATIEEQKGDKRIMARNRRMFGMILGTLQKFQNEESRRKEQAKKRAEIEKKVEEASEKEKEAMKKEKEHLFITRREKQTQIRCLEKKLERAEIHEVWKSNYSVLTNFIQTSTKPHIFYMPAKHNKKSQEAFKQSQERISALIKEHTEAAEKELAEIDECYKKDESLEEIPGDKENILPYEDAEEKPSDLIANQNMSTDKQNSQISKTEENIRIETDKEDQPPNTDANRTEESLNSKDKTSEVEKDVLETLTDQDFEPIYDEYSNTSYRLLLYASGRFL